MRGKQRISDHVTYTEATKSSVGIKLGIDNTPGTEELANMKHVAENVFEKVRARFCVPIAVTSFFRSKKVNKEVKGSKTSQHVKGEAMDLDGDVFGMVANHEIFSYIKDNLDFDQLIWEFGTDVEPAWVHVSLRRTDKNRKIAMQAYKEKDWKGDFVTKYKYIY